MCEWASSQVQDATWCRAGHFDYQYATCIGQWLSKEGQAWRSSPAKWNWKGPGKAPVAQVERSGWSKGEEVRDLCRREWARLLGEEDAAADAASPWRSSVGHADFIFGTFVAVTAVNGHPDQKSWKECRENPPVTKSICRIILRTAKARAKRYVERWTQQQRISYGKPWHFEGEQSICWSRQEEPRWK